MMPTPRISLDWIGPSIGYHTEAVTFQMQGHLYLTVWTAAQTPEALMGGLWLSVPRVFSPHLNCAAFDHGSAMG